MIVGFLWSTRAVGAEANNGSELEQITVYSPQPNDTSLGGTTITQDDVRQFNRDTLDTAISLACGASVSSVGARNETDIWIRGFDRWRVPPRPGRLKSATNVAGIRVSEIEA